MIETPERYLKATDAAGLDYKIFYLKGTISDLRKQRNTEKDPEMKQALQAEIDRLAAILKEIRTAEKAMHKVRNGSETE